ncbi:MAG: O-antigen ligase family protein [Candidatus Kerfeldbacteria bacterium]
MRKKKLLEALTKTTTYNNPPMPDQKQTPIERVTEILLLAVIFVLPWQTRWIAIPGELNGGPWEYGTVSLYGLDILIILFLIFAIGHVALQKRKLDINLSHWLAIFLVVVAFFSIVFAGNQINALFWCAKLAEGVALFIFIPQLNIKRARIAAVLVITALIQSALAFQQFFMQQVIGLKWLGMASQLPETLGVQVVQVMQDGTSERILRAYGSLPHPNMLAGLLTVAILTALVYYATHKTNTAQILYGAALVILSSALFFTFSRQAWIALAAAVAILVAFTFIKQKQFPARVAIGIAAVILPFIVLTAMYPQLVTARMQSDAPLEQLSMSERQLYAEQATQMLKKEWVTGVGMGNYTAFLHAQDAKQDIIKETHDYQPVHNIYLLAFAELGIFGALGFILFLLSLFMGRDWKNPHTLAWALPVIALLTIGLFDHYLLTLHFGILLLWLTSSQTKLI